MRRLLWKESWSAIWILGIAVVWIVWVSSIGDPMFFRGDESTSKSYWIVLVFLILGLKSYSSELSHDTVTFLYSRAIPWWQIWTAKLLSGLLWTFGIVVFSAVMYALTVPEIYRPFLLEGLTHGSLRACGFLTVAYLLGSAVSVLSPGIARSFLALVAAVMLFVLPFALIGYVGNIAHLPGLVRVAERANPVISILGPISLAVAGILVARALAKLDQKHRWLLWLKLPILALCIAFIAALAGLPLGVCGHDHHTGMALDLSPDGRWAVYGPPARVSGISMRFALVDTTTGDRRLAWSGADSITSDWAGDSTRFAYLDRDYTVRLVTTVPTPSVKDIVRIDLPESARSSEISLYSLYLSWSPDKRLLGILWSDYDSLTEQQRIVIFVVDTEDRSVRRIEYSEFMETQKAVAAMGPDPVPVQGFGPNQIFWPLLGQETTR